MYKKSLISWLGTAYQLAENCKDSNGLWQKRHLSAFAKMLATLPSGAGIDNGIKLVSIDRKKAIFEFSFHHMNDAGFYTKWTFHKLTVSSCLDGSLDIRISGYNHANIKDYLYELFFFTLTEEYDYSDFYPEEKEQPCQSN